jgi:hypothetical protein
MPYKIRDWGLHFEADRSRQWKTIKWVPIPNKQGSGYRRIMSEKNGLEIFACWIALVEVGSLCSPRGDLTKYTLEDLSRLTLCDIKKLEISIIYCSQVLDWIEVIENLDKNVNECQKNVCVPAVGSSILFNSIQCSSIPSLKSAEKLSFETFWKEYPKLKDKGHAFKSWLIQIKTTEPEIIIAGAKRYAIECQGKEEQYIKMAQGWLTGQRWLDETAKQTAIHPTRILQ